MSLNEYEQYNDMRPKNHEKLKQFFIDEGIPIPKVKSMPRAVNAEQKKVGTPPALKASRSKENLIYESQHPTSNKNPKISKKLMFTSEEGFDHSASKITNQRAKINSLYSPRVVSIVDNSKSSKKRKTGLRGHSTDLRRARAKIVAPKIGFPATSIPRVKDEKVSHSNSNSLKYSESNDTKPFLSFKENFESWDKLPPTNANQTSSRLATNPCTGNTKLASGSGGDLGGVLSSPENELGGRDVARNRVLGSITSFYVNNNGMSPSDASELAQRNKKLGKDVEIRCFDVEEVVENGGASQALKNEGSEYLIKERGEICGDGEPCVEKNLQENFISQQNINYDQILQKRLDFVEKAVNFSDIKINFSERKPVVWGSEQNNYMCGIPKDDKNKVQACQQEYHDRRPLILNTEEQNKLERLFKAPNGDDEPKVARTVPGDCKSYIKSVDHDEIAKFLNEDDKENNQVMSNLRSSKSSISNRISLKRSRSKTKQPSKAHVLIQNQNFERTGFFVETWTDGSKYRGFWVNGRKEGKGVLTWADGSSYTGNFEKNYFHGFGKKSRKRSL